MKFLVDSADLEQIEEINEAYPLHGVTTNPTIMKKEGGVNFFDHLKEIQKIIGNKELHVQTTSNEVDEIVREGEHIVDKLGKENVYIKVPVFEEGMKAIKILKKEGILITATGVYTEFQAYMALELGAEKIAPYYNRMCNLNIDPDSLISNIAAAIDRYSYDTEILAASFKNVAQVNAAIKSGAQTVTMGPDVMRQTFLNPSISKAVKDFRSDFTAIHGEKSIYDL